MIKLIAIDLDGTLLNSQKEMTAFTEATIKRAIAQGVQVVLATGKTRASATDIIERLSLTTPGIYVQGLSIHNSDGSIRYQRTLEPLVAQSVITYAEHQQHTLLVYSGARIFARELNHHTHILVEYHETTPEAFGSLNDFAAPINKMLFIDEPATIEAIHAHLKTTVNGTASLVKSMPFIVEVLPLGASKGKGLQLVANDLNISPKHILAIGDAENDIEMLQFAEIGVAVGNAMPRVKAIADHVVGTHDEDGVAEAIERFVLQIDEQK